MENLEKTKVRDFYNSISIEYDKQLESGIIAGIVRKIFQNKLLNNFKPGSTILELGCGTGTDTVFLGKNNIIVNASDISPGMIKIANEKISNANLSSYVKLCESDSEEVIKNSSFVYDGIISDFDSVNYLDLNELNTHLVKIVKPNRTVQFAVLNKRCLWEFLYYFLKLHPLKAIGCLKHREKYFVNRLTLKSPGEFYKYFSKNFKLTKVTGIGLLIPPDGFKGIQRKFQFLFRKIEKLDTFIASRYMFRNLCDHYIIEMARIDTRDD